jgi:hypothetical protein
MSHYSVSVITKTGELREYKFPNLDSAKSFSKYPRKGWKILTKPYKITIRDGRWIRYPVSKEKQRMRA